MISLFVSTCDDYSYLWENFALLCEKHWLVDCEKTFICENKECDIPGFKSHLPGKIPWTDRIISAIEGAKTEYVFFMLEDYFLTEPITQADIELYIEFMEENDANKIMIEPLSYLMKYDMKNYTKFKDRFVYKIMDNSDYLSSVQPSVWKKDYFLSLLKPGWSPWEFECAGTDLVRGQENKIYNICGPNGIRTERIYWNAVRKGGIISDGWNEIKNRFNLQEMEK